MSTEVADYWECTEHEVRGKYEMYLRTFLMARRRVQARSLLEPKFQLIKRCFRPIVLDTVPRTMQKMAMNAGLFGVSPVMFAVFVEAGPGSRADREQPPDHDSLDHLGNTDFERSSVSSSFAHRCH